MRLPSCRWVIVWVSNQLAIWAEHPNQGLTSHISTRDPQDCWIYFWLPFKATSIKGDTAIGDTAILWMEEILHHEMKIG